MDLRQQLERYLEDALAWVVTRDPDYDFEEDEVLLELKTALLQILGEEDR